jgi:hypothetical protein
MRKLILLASVALASAVADYGPSIPVAGAAQADFLRHTPEADWQQRRAQELLDMSARLDAKTLVWRMRSGTAEDFRAINSQLENWKPRTRGPSTGKYDPGWGAIDLYMLAYECGEKLTPAARAKLFEVLEEYTKPGEYAYETEPRRMINTNHPINGAMALVLAGQLMGKPERIALGRDRVRYFLDWLRDVTPADLPEQFAERRKAAQLGNVELSQGTGDTDEYNSPTYQAVTLHGLAGLSNWATDRETALKARLLQEYLFLLTCARYDASVRILCGPYSRSYPPNTAGVVGNLYYILHRYLKSALPLDPDLANKDWGRGSADIYWIPRLAAMPYYFPDYLRPIAEQKSYPYSVLVSTKSGDWGDYPYEDHHTKLYATGGHCDLTSYLAEDYCLGSSSRYYAYAGQNENCILYYRKRPVAKPEDRKFVIFRYLIDGRDPFDSVRDGLPHVYQHENRAIVLFHPAMRPKAKTLRAWAGFFDGYDPLDAIYVNDTKLNPINLPYTLKPGDTLFVHDGAVHVAVRPLAGQNLGVKGSPIRLEREGRCLGLSVYNYEADQPLPTSLEKVKLINPLRFIRGGFVVEVDDRKHYPDAADFRRHVLAGVVREELKDEKVRIVTYVSGPDTMAISYDMDTDRILSRTLNGKAAAAPLFACPDARMESSGEVTVHGAKLAGERGLPLVLAAPGEQGPFVATKLSDKVGPFSLDTPSVCWKTSRFGCGQIRLHLGRTPRLEIDRLVSSSPLFIRGEQVTVVVNEVDVTDHLRTARDMPGWKELPAASNPAF